MSSSQTTGEARPHGEQFDHNRCQNSVVGRSSAIPRCGGGLGHSSALSEAANWGKVASKPGPIRRIPVKGSWKYLYRAVDKAGDTVDFLLTAKRDRKAALQFLRKAIGHHGVPEKITIDKSGANTAAIESYNAEHEADIAIRQIKYLNNIVEQDHRAVKRVARPMLGFKSFRSAAVTLAGIELMHMVRKGQLRSTGKLCPAQQFYALAA